MRLQLLRLAGQVAFRPDALAVAGRADALVLELVGDPVGEVGAEIAAHDLQHQVDRGGAAGAGVALASLERSNRHALTIFCGWLLPPAVGANLASAA